MSSRANSLFYGAKFSFSRATEFLLGGDELSSYARSTPFFSRSKLLAFAQQLSPSRDKIFSFCAATTVFRATRFLPERQTFSLRNNFCLRATTSFLSGKAFLSAQQLLSFARQLLFPERQNSLLCAATSFLYRTNLSLCATTSVLSRSTCFPERQVFFFRAQQLLSSRYSTSRLRRHPISCLLRCSTSWVLRRPTSSALRQSFWRSDDFLFFVKSFLRGPKASLSAPLSFFLPHSNFLFVWATSLSSGHDNSCPFVRENSVFAYRALSSFLSIENSFPRAGSFLSLVLQESFPFLLGRGSPLGLSTPCFCVTAFVLA